jgi:hypothetical protein
MGQRLPIEVRTLRLKSGGEREGNSLLGIAN